KVPLRIRLGQYEDETAGLCHWHISEAHYLESWSDAQSADGTATIIQPLIAPLYDSKTAHEVIAAFANQPSRPSHEIIEDYWRHWYAERRISGSFDSFFRRSLHDGIVTNTAGTPSTRQLRSSWRDSHFMMWA